MKNIFKILFGLTLSMAVIFPSSAALVVLVCSGKVTYVATMADGRVFVRNGTGAQGVCNLSSTIDGITPDTCQAWYGMFLTLYISGKDISLNYWNEPDTQTCTGLGSWNMVTPNSIEVVE